MATAAPHRRQGRQEIDAHELWEKVSFAAWSCADPGVQYDTTINEWHTCPEDGRIHASNPCSEYMFLDDTACNLASLNLVHFVQEDGSFDIPAFRHAVRLWTIVLEISVLMASFPSKAIAQAQLRVPHARPRLREPRHRVDAPRHPVRLDRRAFAIAASITAVLTGESYATSAEMAEASSARSLATSATSDAMLRVIRNHRRAAYDATETEYEGLSHHAGIWGSTEVLPERSARGAARVLGTALSLEGEKHGYRNAQVTVIAPTGTIGLS